MRIRQDNDSKCEVGILSYHSKDSGLPREKNHDDPWHDEQMVFDMVCPTNHKNAFLYIRKCKNFSNEYSVEFSIEPAVGDMPESELDGILKESPLWEPFKQDFYKAFKSQFVNDSLDCLNSFFNENEPEINEEYLLAVEEDNVDLKGDSFSTDKDKALARIVLRKLLIFNGLQAKLNESKLEVTFDSDPFTHMPPGLGLPTTIRNWSLGLKSKKRYLVDKFFEKRFDEIIESLP